MPVRWRRDRREIWEETPARCLIWRWHRCQQAHQSLSRSGPRWKQNRASTTTTSIWKSNSVQQHWCTRREIKLPVDGIFEPHHAEAFFDLLLFLTDDEREERYDKLGQCHHHVKRHQETFNRQCSIIDEPRLWEQLHIQMFQVRFVIGIGTVSHLHLWASKFIVTQLL